MKYSNGHEFEYRWLKPSQINVDTLYQRKLDTARVERIVREFNGDTFNEPKVSFRNGKYWVWDGQHSLAAWRKLFAGEDKSIFCKVYADMTWVDECEAFIAQNGLEKAPMLTDKLRAASNERREDVVEMEEGAKLVGFNVNYNASKNRNNIVAVGALFKAYKTLGNEKYIDMLTAIRDAWDGIPESLSKQIINGMCVFYRAYYGNFKREDLVKSLSTVQPNAIIREGRANRGGMRNGFAREIAKVYNKRRSSRRLDMEAL